MSKIYKSNVWLHPFLTVLRFKTTSWQSFFGGGWGSHSESVPIEVVGYLVMRSGRQNAKVFAKQVLTSGRLGVVHASGG